MGAGPIQRYGEDPVLTRATRRAVLAVGAAVALLALGLGVVVAIVALKFAPFGLFRAVGATHGLLLLVPLAIGVVWVVRELLRPVRARSAAADGALEPGPDHPQRLALARLAALADIPAPPLWIVESVRPNSYVVVEPDGVEVICLTTAALESCTTAELDAMLAHELFHVAHGDARLTGRLEGIAELTERRASWLGRWVVPAVRGLMRQRELAADRAAALLTGRPGDLDSAVRTCTHVGVHAGPPDLRLTLAVPFVEAADGESPGRRTHPSETERAESLARVAAALGQR
jgi:Zn-dependent protease with chaperone function